jgi:hypothetical protein
MNRLVKACLLAAICAGMGYALSNAVHAGDQPASAPVKDPLCKAAAKTGTACHTTSSRTEVLKTYLTEQEKLAASASTNGVKSCDKPPSKAALMLKAIPAKQ